MTGNVYKTAKARQDLVGHFAFFAERDLRVANRFLAAADAAFEHLAQMPTLAGVWEWGSASLRGIRVWPIKRFGNYLVFYRPTPDGIEVLRVLHGAMNVDETFFA